MAATVMAATIIALLTGIVAAHADEPALSRGHLDLRDIDLHEPALILILRDVQRPAPRAGSAGYDTVTLYHLHLDFERSSDKFVVHNGIGCHDAFAATFDGYFGLPAGDLHFNGVIWPTMNAAALLAYRTPAERREVRAREPIFVPVGVSYQLFGPRTAPGWRLNPFADEYPGALRRVTEQCGRPDMRR
jgi:hypothetical protein